MPKEPKPIFILASDTEPRETALSTHGALNRNSKGRGSKLAQVKTTKLTCLYAKPGRLR